MGKRMMQEALANAQKCKEMLNDYATSNPVDEDEYARLRTGLLTADPATAQRVPEVLRKYRTLPEFWGYIKKEFATYAERREHLRVQFEPLLEFLESEIATPEMPEFLHEQDALLSRVVQMLMAQGREREVAVLTAAKLSLAEREDNDSWRSEMNEWFIRVGLPLPLYSQLTSSQREECERAITRAAQELPRTSDDWIAGTTIYVDVKPQENWRGVALKWLKGEGINNQGRVRSDNMPAREADGLLFRSQPEVLLYRALKAKGVVFAPLPVFVRGGATYQRIEPDFIVMQDRAVMLVEVDGDTVHLETPAEADQRTRMFKLEGAYIERVKASECDAPEKADARAARLLADFAKWRGAR